MVGDRRPGLTEVINGLTTPRLRVINVGDDGSAHRPKDKIAN